MAAEGHRSLGERVVSLEDWPHRYAFDIQRIAEAGYYFKRESDPSSDFLRCFTCGVPLGNWTPGDNPWMEHIKAVPRCCHVLVKFGVEKICRTLAQFNEDYTVDPSLSPYPGVFYQRDEAFNTPEVFGGKGPLTFNRHTDQGGATIGQTSDYTSPRGRPYVKPLIPRLSSVDRRQETFRDIPAHVRPTQQILDIVAESGLYYDARRSVFRCYYCEFSGWTAGYDPWVLHAQHSECFHVILAKGEAYLDQARGLQAALPGHDGMAVLKNPAERRDEDNAEAYTGPLTRSKAKRRREVYTQSVEENSYRASCYRCRGTDDSYGSLHQGGHRAFECHLCIQNTQGQM